MLVTTNLRNIVRAITLNCAVRFQVFEHIGNFASVTAITEAIQYCLLAQLEFALWNRIFAIKVVLLFQNIRFRCRNGGENIATTTSFL